MAWISEVELDMTPVMAFKRARSGKGWILEGQDFDGFMFQSDDVLKKLLVALATWVDSGQGKVLEMHRDSSQKRGFKVEVAMSGKKPVMIRYRLTESGYAICTAEDEPDTNPFL